MNLIIRLLVTAGVAFLLTKILSGVHFDGFGSALIFALILGILNLVVTPILKILGLPLTILTLGLFPPTNKIIKRRFVSGSIILNRFFTSLKHEIDMRIFLNNTPISNFYTF